MEIKHSNPEALAKRMFFLAYEASRVVGMGFLQARQNVTEDQVFGALWKQSHRELPINYCGDYIFGRMVKLNIEVWEDFIDIPDDNPRMDYQSWAFLYATYQDLATEAAVSLDAENG